MPIAPSSSRSASSASAHGPDAVAAAAGAAVESLRGQPGLLVAFTSGIADAGRAAAQLGEAAPGIPSVGMTGKGVFAANEPIDDGCAVVAFNGGLQSAVGIGRGASEDFRAAGHSAAHEALAGLSDQAGLLMLLVDARAGSISDAIAGAYEAAGPDVRLAGGAASGPEPAQYACGEAVTDAVVALALQSMQPIGVGNAHSCSVVGDRSVVTRSEDQLIYEIDGRPAVEVYLERVGGRGDIGDEAFEAMAITHPLGIPESHGNRRLRHVLGRRDGALESSGSIPTGTAIEFTVLSLDELARSGWDSVSASVESLGNRQPAAALVFDCAGRRRVLGHGQAQEVKAITDSFGEVPPLAGLYTDGEIARIHGAKGDHNHAVVTITFA